MARQVTVRPEEAFEPVSSGSGRGADHGGQLQRAGAGADEIVSLLRSGGYHVEVKKLVPKDSAPEATLELAITYSLEKSLFEVK